MPEQTVLPSTYSAHRPCPVCGEDRPRKVFENRMAPLNQLDMSYRVSQCEHCGFHYASDLPIPATYATYYRTMSKYDQRGADSQSASVRYRVETAVRFCAPHLLANALITDVGCGSGALLAGFRAAGFSRLYGIDPAPGAPREAARQFGLQHISIGSLHDANLIMPLAESDLVCLTGVAEHLSELPDDLSKLIANLPKKTKILIEVPAMERFVAPAFEPFGEFSLEHVQYFSEHSLHTLMSRFGYTPLRHAIVDGIDCTSSLFGLYVFDNRQLAAPRTTTPTLTEYIERSSEAWSRALARVTRHQEQFIIFGAGSHSARLLPALQQNGVASRIVGIVDNNPNLQGNMLGNFRIYPQDFLRLHPGMTILISSFHAQSAIAKQLAGRHPCICLYDTVS